MELIWNNEDISEQQNKAVVGNFIKSKQDDVEYIIHINTENEICFLIINEKGKTNFNNIHQNLTIDTAKKIAQDHYDNWIEIR